MNEKGWVVGGEDTEGRRVVRLKKRLARFERLEVEEEFEVEEVGGEEGKVEELGEAKGWSGNGKNGSSAGRRAIFTKGG